MNPYFGSPAYDVSGRCSCYNDSYIKQNVAISLQSLSIVGGNQQLPKAMAARLGREVHRQREVVAIPPTPRASPQPALRHAVSRPRLRLLAAVLGAAQRAPRPGPAGAQDLGVKTFPT